MVEASPLWASWGDFFQAPHLCSLSELITYWWGCKTFLQFLLFTNFFFFFFFLSNGHTSIVVGGGIAWCRDIWGTVGFSCRPLWWTGFNRKMKYYRMVVESQWEYVGDCNFFLQGRGIRVYRAIYKLFKVLTLGEDNTQWANKWFGTDKSTYNAYKVACDEVV